jgi:general L-amino acid transport system substrate-binding protein
MMPRACLAVLLLLGLVFPALAQQGSPTLEAVRSRGVLACGVSGESPGFSLPDSAGEMRGMDADMCRAVAAAALGDAAKVRFVPLSPQARFTALQSGEVDLLVRNTGWTLTREASLGLLMAFVNFHDGTAFVVRESAGVASAKELDGASVCLIPGTSTELDVTEWFRVNRLRFEPVLIGGVNEVQQAFLAGRCDAWANDGSYIAAFRAQNPQAGLRLLPERLSSEPVGAMVRKGDDRWFDLVRWTGFALIAAEQAGVTSRSIDGARSSTDPAIQRIAGTQGDLGRALGVDNGWAAAVIAQVGNYAEMWERNLAPLGLERGPNALARDGGLMWAPSFR